MDPADPDPDPDPYQNVMDLQHWQAASYNRSYAAIEIISFLTILYMCICAYYTIFK